MTADLETLLVATDTNAGAPPADPGEPRLRRATILDPRAAADHQLARLAASEAAADPRDIVYAAGAGQRPPTDRVWLGPAIGIGLLTVGLAGLALANGQATLAALLPPQQAAAVTSAVRDRLAAGDVPESSIAAVVVVAEATAERNPSPDRPDDRIVLPASPDLAARGELLAMIERWRADWSAARLDDYASHYAAGFVGQTDGSAWLARKREVFAKGGAASVQIDWLDVDGRGDHWTAEFRQSYRSGATADYGRKRLDLVRADGKFKIVRETFCPAIRKESPRHTVAASMPALGR